ncbi:hypothetical protein GCM10010191_13710 [Actinomadura vinacea]|uniref:TIGR04222 domain-containing membrane protein n=1 Tax=Actinomadura vinacea TaxID=115336 RepID=A0ABN3IJV6_9ACTN
MAGQVGGLSYWVFLVLLAGGFAVLLAGGAVAHRRLRVGSAPTRDLHPYELAYLDGGGRHAITAALISLRGLGALDAYATGRIQLTGRIPAARTPLDGAILGSLRGARMPSVAAVAADPHVRSAIAQLRDGLAAQGALMGTWERQVARLTPWPARIWLLIWFITGWDDVTGADAVWYRAMLLVFSCVALAAVSFTVGGGNERTRAGERALEEARVRHAHLDPRSRPAYEGDAAPMGVALFGTAALMAIDPVFAQTVGLGRFLAMAGSSSATASSGSGGPATCSSSASVCSSGGCGGGGSCGGGGGGGCGGGGGGGGGCGGGGGG